MPEVQRRLILGNGEQYIQSLTKPPGGRSPLPPRTFSDARDNLRAGVRAVLDAYAGIPAKKRMPGEAVFCLRMHPDATAKSYDPFALFDDTPQLRKIGSRNYRQSIDGVAPTPRIQKLKEAHADEVDGRLVFVQSSVEGFRTFLQRLDRPESHIPKGVQEEIRRVERFDLLTPEERVVGFDAAWKSGRVELVFHPSRVDGQKQLSFMNGLFDEAGVSRDGRQVRSYPGGPTFVSCALTARALSVLKDVNPAKVRPPDGLRRSPESPLVPNSSSAEAAILLYKVNDQSGDV